MIPEYFKNFTTIWDGDGEEIESAGHLQRGVGNLYVNGANLSSRILCCIVVFRWNSAFNWPLTRKVTNSRRELKLYGNNQLGRGNKFACGFFVIKMCGAHFFVHKFL